MRLTYYLFKTSVENFDDMIISNKVCEQNNYEELEVTNHGLDFETRVFIQRNKTKEPKWLGFFRKRCRDY